MVPWSRGLGLTTLQYFNQVLTPSFQQEGIIHELLCINTRQQNEAAKRKNGHLLDTTWAFLFQNNVPKSYQGQVVLITPHLINCLPSMVLGFKSSMKMLLMFYFHMKTINHLIPKIFGWVLIWCSQSKRGEIRFKSSQMYFCGIYFNSKGI